MRKTLETQLLKLELLKPPIGAVFFPNETSFWETPLRIKEIAGDRWEN